MKTKAKKNLLLVAGIIFTGFLVVTIKLSYVMIIKADHYLSLAKDLHQMPSRPAIVYSRNDIENTFAENSVYKQDHQYQIIVIDKDPDSEIVSAVSRLPMCRFNRHYESENLNHDVFTIYYK